MLFDAAYGLTFNLPSNGDNVVGHIKEIRSRRGDTLAKIGRRFDIGYFEMLEANPHSDPERALRPHSRVVIPSRFILPPGPRKGIVINLAELRLYYYPNNREVMTEPVGIGRIGWMTPLGTTSVIQKVRNPSWRPPASVREDAAKQGYILPDVWPAGPDNPLGKFMMRLGWHTYLIHGTNRPDGVGKRSSAGCIRMYPEDIETLFHMVKIGTPVRVVNSPIKVGWQSGELLLEAHKPLQEKGKYVTDDTVSMIQRIHKTIQKKDVLVRWSLAQKEIKQQTGIPVVISLPPSRN